MYQNEFILGSVFAAGFLSFFAPCTFPLIPAYIGMLGDEDKEYRSLNIAGRKISIGAFIKTISFILGLSTSFILLGFSAGFLGRYIADSRVVFVAGLLVVVLGLHQMDIIHIRKLDSISGVQIQNNKTKALGSYLTGVSFSLGWTPCVSPVLATILTLSASEGKAVYGGMLMFLYTMGLSIPFLIMMLATKFMMSHFAFFKRHMLILKRVGGILIIIMGLVLMSNKLQVITVFFESLFG